VAGGRPDRAAGTGRRAGGGPIPPPQITRVRPFGYLALRGAGEWTSSATTWAGRGLRSRWDRMGRTAAAFAAAVGPWRREAARLPGRIQRHRARALRETWLPGFSRRHRRQLPLFRTLLTGVRAPPGARAGDVDAAARPCRTGSARCSPSAPFPGHPACDRQRPGGTAPARRGRVYPAAYDQERRAATPRGSWQSLRRFFLGKERGPPARPNRGGSDARERRTEAIGRIRCANKVLTRTRSGAIAAGVRRPPLSPLPPRSGIRDHLDLTRPRRKRPLVNTAEGRE